MGAQQFNIKATPLAATGESLHGYHIHIYFETGKASETRATELAQKIEALFPEDIIDIFRIGAVGPHMAPNYGIEIPRDSFGKVISWLQLNNDNLSILIHPRTGDEVKDHMEASMWLGKQLEYNMAFFERFKTPKGPTLQ